VPPKKKKEGLWNVSSSRVLPSKHEALSSKPTVTKKKREREFKKKVIIKEHEITFKKNRSP
jgi:hypothetical protein